MATARLRFGSVRKLASGRYQVRYRDLAGREHTATRTFATKTDAGRFLSNIETDLQRGNWRDPRLGRVTLAAWSTEWMTTTTNLRPSTRDLYGYLLRKHVLPRLGDAAIAQITPLDMRAWLAELHATDLSPNTVAKAYRLLARIMGAAVESGLIVSTPCVVKGAGAEHPAEMRFATVDQVTDLADAVGPRYRALILLAAFGGLRWAELAGLRRRRVDLLHKTVTVAEQLSEVNGQLSHGAPKTSAGLRTVSLSAFLLADLERHLGEWSERGRDGLVFPAPEGGPMRRSNFRRRVWLPATREVGVEGLRFHDLRHSAATLAIAAGANTRDLMERMGHASPAAALRYQHAMPGRDAAIAAALDDLVAAATR
ncbi:MAG: tyrosine-type recombinase/integrase family protein [Acidimicrobiia bacterium]|nr:tyrosine-type recombinase/integrase family protein [Acidimicrobiia bacterium]